MFEQDTIKHHIDRSIVEYLQHHEYARFSELRPKKIDTNHFTYHLKSLMKSGYIIKTDEGYTLDRRGLIYVDRASAATMKLRTQPKIITMLVIKDKDGRVLLHQRRKQPYINTWTLPYGKFHIDDTSVTAAAMREAREKLGYSPSAVNHIGDCYIVVRQNDAQSDGHSIESRTLAHIMMLEANDITINEQLMWADLSEFKELELAPAVELIIRRTLGSNGFFFEEFTVTVP